jgi:hypothetical protein
LNIDEFFRVRINRGRRKGAIEIPIISKVWLKWQEEIKVIDPGRQVLENNQFPVAMEDISLIKDKGLLLRNFETALTVGLLKARLAMIKKEDTKIDKESLSDIIFRLQGVYDLFADIKTEFEQMTIDERFIDNMVSEYPEVRLGHAIQTALPAITRMFVNELKQYHDLIQFIQCVA